MASPAGICLKCGRPDPVADRLCAACWRDYPPYNRARAVGLYEGPLREAILRLKGRGERYLAGPLAGLMALVVRREFFPPHLLAAVPAHPRRIRERGFNQAELLAGAMGAILGVPAPPGILRREGGRPPQHTLAGEARARNAAGAFLVEPAGRTLVKGKNILLVDDIYTTGATAGECARALMETGSARVDVITVATVIPGMAAARGA